MLTSSAPCRKQIAWPSPVLTALLAETPRPHHPVMLGALVGVAGGSPHDAAMAVAYLSVSGPASAAVRLLGLDPFAVNAVAIGHTVIMAKPTLCLRTRLAEHGYKVVGLDLDPFLLSGGGAFCMTLRLDLRSTPQRLRSLNRS